MLKVKTREKLKMRFYPTADQVILRPVRMALEKYIQPGARVLDAGCGRGTTLLRNYRSIMGCWVGIDAQTPKEYIMNEFVSCDLENIPLKDATFDVIICHYVIEHLRQPPKVFTELWRLLADGGILIFCTPCINSPLFLLSRWIPNRWHKTVKRKLLGSEEAYVFPTYYKCNTARKLDKTLQAIGFCRETLESTDHIYKYFAFNIPTYALGLIISRLMQFFPLAKPIRSQILGVYYKP